MMTTFSEQLAKAKAAKEAKRETEDVEVEVAGELVKLRFTEMDGPDWSALTIKYQPRDDVLVDQRFQYNVHAVCRDAAPLSGVRLDGDDEVALTVDPKAKPPVDEWADLFSVISGHDFTVISDAIWSLNEWAAHTRLEQAKKGSSATPGRAKK